MITENRGALSGIRVVELGQLIAGLFCDLLSLSEAETARLKAVSAI